jgi:hypothetical protein
MEENNINCKYIYSSYPSSPIARKKGEGYKRNRAPKTQHLLSIDHSQIISKLLPTILEKKNHFGKLFNHLNNN